MRSPATPYLQFMKGSHDLLFEFLDPFHILGMVEGRNVKFGMQIDHEGY